MAVCMAQA